MRKEDNRFICLTGMDGTGKSTHIAAILEKLDAMGRPYRQVWLRRPYLFSLVVLAYCRLTGLTKISYSGGEKHGQWQFYRSRFVSAVFPWVQMLDAAMLAVLKVHLPLRLGKTVVCDRFVYDTLVDTMLAVRDSELYKKRVGRLFLGLVPHGGRIIFLDCDERIIRERKPETVNDADLQTRRKLYLGMAKELGAPIIDTSQTINQAGKQIIGIIFSARSLAAGNVNP